MDTITGKVAAVINNEQLVINRGKDNFVEKDMVFAIHLTIPSIKDPDEPAKILGYLVYEKGRIKITAVFDKMAVGILLPGSMSERINNPLSDIFGKADNPQALVKKDDWRINVGDEVTKINALPPRAQ